VQGPHLTIERAIQSYLQAHRKARHSPKTIEWHQTALKQFQHYLLAERSLLQVGQITETDVHGWMASLGQRPTTTGKQRSAHTIETYGRSVRAFCTWLVHRGNLICSPLSKGLFPRASVPLPHLIPPEMFEQFVRAGPPPEAKARSMAARDRAVLWVLFDTGISVSEVCALRLGDVDRKTDMLNVRGKGGKERRMTLGPTCLDHLLSYLKQSYQTSKERLAGRSAGEDPLFRCESGQPLTKNSVTLLFGRFRKRAGSSDTPITPQIFRHSFALRYLQAGGDPHGLRELLGYKGMGRVKQHLHWYDQLVRDRTQNKAGRT